MEDGFNKKQSTLLKNERFVTFLYSTIFNKEKAKEVNMMRYLPTSFYPSLYIRSDICYIFAGSQEGKIFTVTE